MKRIILWALLLAAPMVAQPDGHVNKLLTLKNIEPGFVASMFQQWGVTISRNDQIKTLAISGPADKVAAVETAIKQLDVAPRNLELTVYFVVGGDQANQMTTGGAVPQELRDVITQLKGAFTYKEYKMLDVLTLRPRAGSSAETSSLLNTAVPPKMSQFSIRSASVSEDGTTVRIDRMRAMLRIPIPGSSTQKTTEYSDSGIQQDVDVKEGQKVVVGRSSLDGPQQALFLVLTARVVQ